VIDAKGQVSRGFVYSLSRAALSNWIKVMLWR
jgi:hypothetical protein